MHFLFGHIQRQLTVFHLKNLRPQLPHPNYKIVGNGIPAVECHSVTRHIGSQAVRPFIIGLCNGNHAFQGLQILQGSSRSLRKSFPIRLINHHDLCGLCRGKDPQCPIRGNTALLNIGLHISLQILFIEIIGQIGQRSRLFHLIGRIGIRGKNIRHGVCSHLTLNGIPHCRLQIRDGTLTEALYIYPLFPSHCVVEFLHQRVKGCLLGTVIVMPYC